MTRSDRRIITYYSRFIPCFTFKGKRYDFRRGA